MTDVQTSNWITNLVRLCLKGGIWVATAVGLGWLLNLEPTWQVIVVVIGGFLFNFVEAKSTDPVGRWVERFVRLIFWGAWFALLCWLLGVPITWALLLFAFVCTLVEGVLDQLLPTAPLINLQRTKRV